MKADRIYIFVPRVLNTDAGPVRMPSGRAAAQCAHVSAKLAMMHANVYKMTTMVLEVANSQELEWVQKFLLKSGIGYMLQFDNLSDSKKQILQAVATVPITKAKSEKLKYFSLWTD